MQTNNTTKKAAALLEKADAMLSERYNFDGPGWNGGPMHEVNVKRHGDYVDEDKRDEIAQKSARMYALGLKEQKAIRAYIDEYAEDEDAYWSWLSYAGWEQINYEVFDAELFGEKLVYVWKHAYKNDEKSAGIVSRGRMGGHACFNSDVESLRDGLDSVLCEYIHGNEYYGIQELRDAMRTLSDAMGEVERVQAYIKRFNDALSWADELQFRADEHAGELRAEIDKETQRHKEQVRNKAPLLARV